MGYKFYISFTIGFCLFIHVHNKTNCFLKSNSKFQEYAISRDFWSKFLPNDVQKCVWASSVLLHLLCGMFQTRKLLSSEADSKYLPPGCQDRPRIQLSCPTRVKRHRPEDTSHTLIDLSREPEAKKGPEMPKYQIYHRFVYQSKM